MKALASLIWEHQLIARLLGALEGYAERLKEELPVDAGDLAAFASVFSELADDIHHEKEERVLLPFLSRHGFDWNTGVLSTVRKEHEHERYLTDVLCHLGERSTDWSNEDRRHIAATACTLVAFQRQHHHRENTELFPEVIARLSDRALELLQAELEKFDESVLERRARLVHTARELIERYPPTSPAPSEPGAVALVNV